MRARALRVYALLVAAVVACCAVEAHVSAVVPFGGMQVASAPVAFTIWPGNGQSLLIGFQANGLLGGSFGSNVKLADSKCVFWNPNTSYPKGTVMCPADPLDAGLFIQDASSSPCTSINAAEPGWSRTVGAVTADNSCSWITLQGGDAAVAFDWTNADSGTLSIVPFTQPDRTLNTAGGGSSYVYPNNIFGETPLDGFLEQISLLSGGVHAQTVAGQGGAAYSTLKQGGTGNAYAAMINEARAYNRRAAAYFGAGTIVKAGGVIWIQGEANATDTPATYAAHLAELQSNAETDLKAETGQSGTVYLFASPQTAISGSMLFFAPGSTQGVLDAATKFGSKTIYAGSKYALEIAGDGTHMVASSYRRVGIKLAEIANDVSHGGTGAGLWPVTITGSGTTWTATYNVPHGCLQWDLNVPNPHQTGTYSDTTAGGAGRGWSLGHGFEAYKAAGTIQGVTASIATCTTVTLTTFTSDVGYFGYGMVADASAPCTACCVRNGQLADQDTFVGYDAETLTCTTTSGSNRISCSDTTGINNRRSLYDSVTGSGIPAGAAIGTRAGGSGTVDLVAAGAAANATASATVPLSFHYNMLNYGAQFQVQIGAPASVVCSDITPSVTGQQSRCSGTNFIGSTAVGAAIPNVWVASGGSNIAQLTVSYVSSTVLELVGSMPSLSAGLYDIVVENPYNVPVTFTNAINATSTPTAASILNLACRGNWRPSGIVGSPATSWTDSCGFGQTLSAFAGSAGLVVTATSANFNNAKTVTFNGSNDDMQVTGFPQVATAGDPVMMILVARLLNTTNARVLFGTNNAGQLEFQRNATNARWIGAGPLSTWTGTDPLNTNVAWYGWSPGGSGSQQAAISINNGSFVLGTAATINSTALTATLSLGSRVSASIPTNFETPEALFVSWPAGTTLASRATQVTATQSMFHTNYGL
jgi:hypothetical protein